MKNFQITQFRAFLFYLAMVLALATNANAADHFFKANGKAVSEGSKVSVSLEKLDMEFVAEESQITKVEMFALNAGEVRNSAQFTKVAAFNANAGNFARNMAQAGDELKVRVTLSNGNSKEYILKLNN